MRCRTILISVYLLLTTGTAFGQGEGTNGSTPAPQKALAFIPKGYELLDEGIATGDLNKDGQMDVALALHSPANEENDPEAERLLLVLLRTLNGYKLAGKSSSVLMCKGCGGIFGDPWQSISIDKGILSVSHYGGQRMALERCAEI